MELLQLQYKIQLLLTIVSVILIVCILFICLIHCYLEIRKISKNWEEMITFTCTICNASFTLPFHHLIQHPFLFKKKKTLTIGGLRKVTSLQYRLLCPHCHKKTWCIYPLSTAPSILSLLPKGFWKKHIIRFLLLEGFVCLFFSILIQWVPAFIL
ncbi:hypothetical protein [Merdibacter massiliensis]|uniref:hypothetical protein n=1 Tax=Merdibacter massiliensis TaxID=1871030 RepID=UPI00096A3AA3|nr:hypothetical protein [Merdibacter massiliensis]